MKIIDALDEGHQPVVYGDGSQAYDFVHVGDCAAANVCAMRADNVARYYNVGTGKRTTIKELTELILRLTGSNQEIHYEEGGLTFVKNRIGSPERATSEIGFISKMNLEDGLRELIAWRNAHKDQVRSRRQKSEPVVKIA